MEIREDRWGYRRRRKRKGHWYIQSRGKSWESLDMYGQRQKLKGLRYIRDIITIPMASGPPGRFTFNFQFNQINLNWKTRGRFALNLPRSAPILTIIDLIDSMFCSCVGWDSAANVLRAPVLPAERLYSAGQVDSHIIGLIEPEPIWAIWLQA